MEDSVLRLRRGKALLKFHHLLFGSNFQWIFHQMNSFGLRFSLIYLILTAELIPGGKSVDLEISSNKSNHLRQ